MRSNFFKGANNVNIINILFEKFEKGEEVYNMKVNPTPVSFTAIKNSNWAISFR